MALIAVAEKETIEKGLYTGLKEVNKMNPETNKFEMLDPIVKEDDERLNKMYDKLCGGLVRPNGEPVPKHWSIFQVGQHYVINNYTFKCAYIGETSILFEPVGVVEIGNGEKEEG